MGAFYCWERSIGVKTARERMRTKRGLHPCYVTVAGDVALV